MAKEDKEREEIRDAFQILYSVAYRRDSDFLFSLLDGVKEEMKRLGEYAEEGDEEEDAEMNCEMEGKING